MPLSRLHVLRRVGFAAALAACAGGLPQAAAADGEFFQLDVAPRASSVTATARRDRVTVTAGWSEFTTGHATTLWVNYGLPLGDGAWIRLGPSLRLDDAGRTDLGAKIAIERFSMTERSTLFLLAELNSIQREYMALAQIGHRATRIAAEISLQGNRSGFRERSLAVSYGLAGSPVRLRAGYRFNARRAFVGFAINTF